MWRSERVVVVPIDAVAVLCLFFVGVLLRATCMVCYLSDEGIHSGVVAL
jgi:hypothetical protein